MRTETRIDTTDYVVSVVDAYDYAVRLAKTIDKAPVLVSVQIRTELSQKGMLPTTFTLVFVDSQAKGKTCSVRIGNYQKKAWIMGIGSGLKIADIRSTDPNALSMLDLTHVRVDVSDALIVARSCLGEESVSSECEVELLLCKNAERLVWMIMMDCTKNGIHRQVLVDVQTGKITDENAC